MYVTLILYKTLYLEANYHNTQNLLLSAIFAVITSLVWVIHLGTLLICDCTSIHMPDYAYRRKTGLLDECLEIIGYVRATRCVLHRHTQPHRQTKLRFKALNNFLSAVVFSLKGARHSEVVLMR